jgi:hypothetical protein
MALPDVPAGFEPIKPRQELAGASSGRLLRNPSKP